jgi:hypothetical protein
MRSAKFAILFQYQAASGGGPGKLDGMGKLPKIPLLSQLKIRCLIE